MTIHGSAVAPPMTHPSYRDRTRPISAPSAPPRAVPPIVNITTVRPYEELSATHDPGTLEDGQVALFNRPIARPATAPSEAPIIAACLTFLTSRSSRSESGNPCL